MTVQKQTKPTAQVYKFLVFYVGVDDWGNTCSGSATVTTAIDLLSVDDSDAEGLKLAVENIRLLNGLRSAVATNIIERRSSSGQS